MEYGNWRLNNIETVVIVMCILFCFRVSFVFFYFYVGKVHNKQKQNLTINVVGAFNRIVKGKIVTKSAFC